MRQYSGGPEQRPPAPSDAPRPEGERLTPFTIHNSTVLLTFQGSFQMLRSNLRILTISLKFIRLTLSGCPGR